MRELHPRIAAFRYAIRGILLLLGEFHARVHLVAAAAVVLLAFYLGLGALDWAVLTISITIVLAAEAINTAIEHVVDLASPEWSSLARDAKDLAAACVLISAIGAAVVGAIVFLPHL